MFPVTTPPPASRLRSPTTNAVFAGTVSLNHPPVAFAFPVFE